MRNQVKPFYLREIMKRCGSCEVLKPLKEFNEKRTSPDGRTSCCTNCLDKMKIKRHSEEAKVKAAEYSKVYRENNRKRLNEQKKKHYLDNSEEYKTRTRKWNNINSDRARERGIAYRLSHKDEIKQKKSVYNRANKHLNNARVAKYNYAKMKATPSWLTEEHFKQMVKVYEEASKLMEHHVDHIIPIQGMTVCGLHVPWNLQILPKPENSSKRNYWWPDMPDEKPKETLKSFGIDVKYKDGRHELLPTKKDKLKSPQKPLDLPANLK